MKLSYPSPILSPRSSDSKTSTAIPEHHDDEADQDEHGTSEHHNAYADQDSLVNVQYDDGQYHDGKNSDQIKQVPIGYLEKLPRPHIGSIPYGQVIKSCNVPGTLALTFDDGPWTYTEDLLDLLDSEDVRATFFVCGGNLDWKQITGHGNPYILRRMMTSGHQIGSHTWGHPDLSTISEEQIFEDMYKNEQALISAIGVVPTYVRPPYLSTNAKTLGVMGNLGYHIVNLDLDTHDWAGDYEAAEQSFLDAIQASDPGSSSHLVLAHDIHEETVHEFAEFMIEEGKAAGYRFVTVGECLGDPARNWYRNRRNGGPLAESKPSTQSEKVLKVDNGPVWKDAKQIVQTRETTARATPTTIKKTAAATTGDTLVVSSSHMRPQIIEKRDSTRFSRIDAVIDKIFEQTRMMNRRVVLRNVHHSPTTTFHDRPENIEENERQTGEERYKDNMEEYTDFDLISTHVNSYIRPVPTKTVERTEKNEVDTQFRHRLGLNHKILRYIDANSGTNTSKAPWALALVIGAAATIWLVSFA